jgi:hypothetical protein
MCRNHQLRAGTLQQANEAVSWLVSMYAARSLTRHAGRETGQIVTALRMT